MGRYFFEIAYDGGAFYGWQIQPKQVSVQETIEQLKEYTVQVNPREINLFYIEDICLWLRLYLIFMS